MITSSQKLLMARAGVSAAGGIYEVASTTGFPSVASTSYSSTVSIGTAHSDREIWVVVLNMGPSSLAVSCQTLTVTVGGNSLTKVFEHLGGAYTNNFSVAYWRYTDNGALGGSATVAVTINNTNLHAGILVFTAKSGTSLLASYADDTENTSPTTSSISTATSGWSFYCAASQNASSGTVGTFGNNGSFDMGTNEWVVYGYNTPEDGGTVLVDNPTNSGTGRRLISAISTE